MGIQDETSEQRGGLRRCPKRPYGHLEKFVLSGCEVRCLGEKRFLRVLKGALSRSRGWVALAKECLRRRWAPAWWSCALSPAMRAWPSAPGRPIGSCCTRGSSGRSLPWLVRGRSCARSCRPCWCADGRRRARRASALWNVFCSPLAPAAIRAFPCSPCGGCGSSSPSQRAFPRSPSSDKRCRPTRPRRCCGDREGRRASGCREPPRSSPCSAASACACGRYSRGSCSRSSSCHASSSSARRRPSAPSCWAVGLPRDGRIAVLDRLVLLAAWALHGRRHDGGVNDLAAHGQIAPALQRGVEGIKQRLDQPRLRELLAIQPHCRRVGHPIRKAQSQEAHEREPVADLILELVVREIVERLQNQRLEDDDLVPRLASGRVLPLLLRLAPNRAQLSAEVLPGHNLVQENQRILLGIKTAIALVKVEETRLTHFCPSPQSQQVAPPSKSRARERSIFRGAHKWVWRSRVRDGRPRWTANWAFDLHRHEDWISSLF